MAKKINKNLKETVYDNIYKDVVLGKYTVQTIFTEKELIEKYKVSKSPVREALIELCNDKVLISIPRKGYQIAQILPKELYDAIELREVIEISSLRKTIEVLNDDILNQLKDYIDETANLKNQFDVLKHWKRNIGFHLLLCSFSNNKWMYDTLESILNFCTRGASQYYSEMWKDSHEVFKENARLHIELFNAIENRDFKRSEEILTKDIYAMKKRLF